MPKFSSLHDIRAILLCGAQAINTVYGLFCITIDWLGIKMVCGMSLNFTCFVCIVHILLITLYVLVSFLMEQ
jgi:hypothetical protein